MMVEKRLPDVYSNHSLLDEALLPFREIAGHLVVSERADSTDWWFTLRRDDGELVRSMLPTRNEPRPQLVRLIRDLLTTMLKA
jgi:hypothetical protein